MALLSLHLPLQHRHTLASLWARVIPATKIVNLGQCLGMHYVSIVGNNLGHFSTVNNVNLSIHCSIIFNIRHHCRTVNQKST